MSTSKSTLYIAALSIITAVFCQPIFAMGSKRTVQQLESLRSNFEQSSTDVGPGDLGPDGSQWSCSFYDIVLKSDVVDTGMTFKQVQTTEGQPAIYGEVIGGSPGLGQYLFLKSGDEWVRSVAREYWFLRAADSQTLIMEVSGDPNGFAGANRQIQCKAESDCFLANSSIDPSLDLEGYEICVRGD